MDDELRREIEGLKAQIEALTSDRLPKVDRASKRRDKRQVFAGFGLFAVAVIIAGTMSASALSGSNTVLSDDIKDTEVHGVDINTNAVTGAKVKDDTLTGSDIKESTLVLPHGLPGYEVVIHEILTVPNNGAVSFQVSCPVGKVAVGGGIHSNPATRAILSESYPGGIGYRSWYLSATNRDTAFSVSVTGYAVCATAPTG